MISIGLTGSIAAGKNTVAKMFEERGCYTVDADDLSRSVILNGKPAYAKIIAAFGETLIGGNGEIDRGKLRKTVMDDMNRLELLETIVHPYIAKEFAVRKNEIAKADSKAIVVYQAPLIIEAGLCGKFDSVVIVWCSPEKQLDRLAKRGYPPYEEAMKLLSKQAPFSEKLSYANHVINNDNSMAETALEVERVLNLIKLYAKVMKKRI
jgi:dephospho-CoA kinase